MQLQKIFEEQLIQAFQHTDTILINIDKKELSKISNAKNRADNDDSESEWSSDSSDLSIEEILKNPAHIRELEEHEDELEGENFQGNSEEGFRTKNEVVQKADFDRIEDNSERCKR